jgi:hypothetical protein
MPIEHRLETRAHLLAERLSHEKATIVEALRPEGKRTLFSKQLSKPEALKFWQQHRFDEIGAQVLARMSPSDVMELDAALTQANEAEMYAPPVEEEDGYSY